MPFRVVVVVAPLLAATLPVAAQTAPNAAGGEEGEANLSAQQQAALGQARASVSAAALRLLQDQELGAGANVPIDRAALAQAERNLAQLAGQFGLARPNAYAPSSLPRLSDAQWERLAGLRRRIAEARRQLVRDQQAGNGQAIAQDQIAVNQAERDFATAMQQLGLPLGQFQWGDPLVLLDQGLLQRAEQTAMAAMRQLAQDQAAGNEAAVARDTAALQRAEGQAMQARDRLLAQAGRAHGGVARPAGTRK